MPAKNKQIINPFGINFANPPDDKTLNERMATMPTAERVKLQEVLNKGDAETVMANKAVLYGLIYSASLGGITAIDPKIKEAFDKAKKDAPSAFTFGEAAGSFTPLPGKLAKYGAKGVSSIVSKLPALTGPIGRNIADMTKFGLESSGGVMAVEAFNTDKLMNAIKQNNGDIMAGLQQRIKEVRQAGQDGFIYGTAVGGLAKASKLPEQIKQKRINEIKESMNENGFRFKQRTPGQAQTEIAKVLNVPKNQADEYFSTFGREVEDTIADMGLTGNLEELRYQSSAIPGKDTAVNKALKRRQELLGSDKAKSSVDHSTIDSFFKDTYDDIAMLKERGFTDEAANAEKAVDKLKGMMTRNGRKPNLSDVYDDYAFINQSLRKHNKSKTGTLPADDQDVLERVSKNMRKYLDTETGGEFIKAQSEIRALDILKKTAGGTGQAVKKETMPHKTFKALNSTYGEIIDSAADKIGVDPRTLSDITGKTSIRSKTIDKLRKVHEDELNIVRGYEDRVYNRPVDKASNVASKIGDVIETKGPQVSTAVTEAAPDITRDPQLSTDGETQDLETMLQEDLGTPADTSTGEAAAAPATDLDTMLQEDLGK